jgi:putative methyltransferase (TIGR04325 family)
MFRKIIHRIIGKKIGFYNKFYNYDEALKSCDGYNNKYLINYIYKKNIKAIKNNKFEQDGIIYDNPVVNKFILKYFCYDYILKKKFDFNKKIRVLDYGGSFGNLYYSIKNFINLNLNWEIIEQKQKVKFAKKNKLFNEIKFQSKIASNKKYDVVIFNTSFQYLPNPEEVFASLKNKSNIFIFTNLILNNCSNNYLRIENPDPKVYDYKYPCWFLSKFFFKGFTFKNFKITKKKIHNPPYALSSNETYYNIILERKK